MAPQQYALDLSIEVERDVGGVEMGVLGNGIPYLTQKGLSQLCGIARSTIFDISLEWEDSYDDPITKNNRIGVIKKSLYDKGYSDPKLYIELNKNGTVHHAYPDIVCMAILEYYVFNAPKVEATFNYRKMASFGFQQYIYGCLGYTPEDRWKFYHERVSLLNDAPPSGYYIVFNETTGLIVDLINSNLTINHKTIPDISIGRAWSEHWVKNKLDSRYGERIKFSHNYPKSYPQSASNPQPAWAYPELALAEFRQWFKGQYLPTKFPRYILSKANILPGGMGEALQIASLFEPKKLSGGD